MRSAYLTLIALLLATAVGAAESHQPPGQLMPGAEQHRLRRPGQNAAPPGLAQPGKGRAGAAPQVASPVKGKAKTQQGGKPADGTAADATADAAESGKADTTAATNAIDNDTIILVNEQRFQGTVLSDQPDPSVVAVNTGSGIMRIRRDLVARVEYGLIARMAQVKDDDLAALIDLAHWCRINRRNPEALLLLTKAVALPGCDLETRGFYAQLVDETDGPEKALPLYIAYRNAGGTDPDILARLDVLQKAHVA